ncbi:MAG: hypothetical protein ACE5R4_15055 [Armatimonadota bacterium]
MKQLLDLLISRAHNWATAAPWIAALMALGAAVVFWAAFSRRRPGQAAEGLWPWLRAVLESSVAAGLFMAILWGVRLELNYVERAFRRQHGRVTEVNLQSVRSIWGRPHVQHDLQVTHTVVDTVQEELPRPYPDAPRRFVTKQVTRHIEQNSILKTRGTVTIRMNYRRKGSAYYTCFEDDCDFLYEVRNLAERETTADFRFPMSSGQNLFLDFQVLVDGEDYSEHLSFRGNDVYWSMPMPPGRQVTVEVSYKSRGMETWYYQIPEAREVRDFELVMHLPDVPRERLNYPEGCLTPTEIKDRAEGEGSVLTWSLDHAITTRGMGVALPDAPQPGNQVARVLQYAWRGGMLLLVGLVVSVLGAGLRLGLLRLAIVGGACCAQFMLLAALSDFRPGFVGAFAIGAVIALALSLAALRWPAGAWGAGPVSLVCFFVIVYPLLALPKAAAAALVTAADIALIAYLAGAYVRQAAGRARLSNAGQA